MWHFFHFIMSFPYYGHFNQGIFLFHISQWKHLNAVNFYLFFTYNNAKIPTQNRAGISKII